MTEKDPLPKDLLADLESGDRSSQWLQASDSRDTFESQVARMNQLSGAMSAWNGSSFASATQMQSLQGLQNQQFQGGQNGNLQAGSIVEFNRLPDTRNLFERVRDAWNH